MSQHKIPSPSEESRATKVSPGVDPCEGMAKPAAGDASDSQHGLSLERIPEFTNPLTGEIIPLTARSDELGRLLADVREVESMFREAKKLVSRELSNRMDRSATWTMRLDGLKITGQSPQPSEEWDGAELREALLSLVDEGVLSIEAVDAAVETVVSYKPRKVGITALRKLGGRVAETVNGLCREVEKERRISVSRS